MRIVNNIKQIGVAFILCCILGTFPSCSIEKRLSKKYEGASLYEIKKELGTPKSTFNLKNGKQLVVFEKIEHLNAAKVNTHSFQYDQLKSPPVEKKERYSFFLDKSGKVVDFKFERLYER